MTSYDSPIGKKQFTGQQMRETVIPDESGPPRSTGRRPPAADHQQIDEATLQAFNARMNPLSANPTQEQAEIEQQFREAREAKRLGHERLSEGARRRIEMLVGMTRVTRTADIGGNIY